MLLPGMESSEKVRLIISLTKISSEAQIKALHRHFVDGANASACAEIEGIAASNFQRAIDKVQEVSKIVDEIKEIDWARFKSDK